MRDLLFLAVEVGFLPPDCDLLGSVEMLPGCPAVDVPGGLGEGEGLAVLVDCFSVVGFLTSGLLEVSVVEGCEDSEARDDDDGGADEDDEHCWSGDGSWRTGVIG